MTEQYLREKLRDFTPRLDELRHQQRRSAVTLSLRDNGGELEVLMMERAQREGDPWSGQMSFPGGRMDPGDRHSYDAAVRECWEEVGIDLRSKAVTLGRLSDVHTHVKSGPAAMSVSSYVFFLPETPAIVANYEVADTIWLPLSYLAETKNRTTMSWWRGDSELILPCYYYREKQVWGLSLLLLDELVALCEGAVSR
ncbi:8-oxo-dGTP pyrophosphatase MutT (NUDIX family) [Sinobacterium caligoides]|uniref:8-oxo-dGTP pyrophosphatase MutT (NUDIX family) n=1 Tax=Sinobacterium caligoides TaxID=933926 RepID=A0A3N2DG81_9GAMM|nr:CoA pyrophosphatase [Sinobacterium caligoides]ROR98803.1 8-oxo-dGTP pyrophosphatase MutT (NUDIX family) [Sinobacterium caligoides]